MFHFGIDNNNVNICVTKTQNDKNNELINDRKDKSNSTNWEEQDNNNDVGSTENNNIEKELCCKENDGKVETVNADIESHITTSTTELIVRDNNSQVECKNKTNDEEFCLKFVNDNAKCDNHKNEQSHNTYVELHRDTNLNLKNGNNNKDTLNVNLKKHNKAQDSNSSSEESNDSDESSETSDCSVDKLDKRYRQSTKSKTNYKNNARKQGSKQNRNDVIKLKRENNSNNRVNNEKCDSCGQFLNDPELLYYQGHPQDAVEEYVALTDDKLVLTAGELVVYSKYY